MVGVAIMTYERKLAEETTWVEPPSDGADRLMAAIRAEMAADVPARPVAVPVGDRRPAMWAVAAAAVVVALVAGVVLGRSWPTGDGQGSEEIGPELTLAGTELAATASARAVMEPRPAGTVVRLELANLPPAEVGTYYQGWVEGADGSVSVGTFHLRDGDTVYLWSGVDLDDYPGLRITLQREGAGPGPSDDVVLTG